VNAGKNMVQTSLFGGSVDQRSMKKRVKEIQERRIRRPFNSILVRQQIHTFSPKELGEEIVRRIKELNHPLIAQAIVEDFNNHSGYISVIVKSTVNRYLDGRGVPHTAYVVGGTLVPEAFSIKRITDPIRRILTIIRNTEPYSARIIATPQRVYTESYGFKNFEGYNTNIISIDYET